MSPVKMAEVVDGGENLPGLCRGWRCGLGITKDIDGESARADGNGAGNGVGGEVEQTSAGYGIPSQANGEGRDPRRREWRPW